MKPESTAGAMERSSPIRILGLSVSKGATAAAAATLLDALDARHQHIGSLHPELTPVFDLLVKLRRFHPDRATWRARAGFNDANFNALTGALERQLRRLDGSFDLIFQVQTVFAPGDLEARRPFVVYTDNIMSLTERFYPAWARLSAAEFRHWRELEAHICRSADRVLAWSNFLRDALIADYGCEPSRVLRVGAGANLVLPSIESRRWDSATAIFVGRDFARKGGPVLLDAWALVRERLPHARLIVVGPPRPPEGVDLTGVDWRGSVTSRTELTGLYEDASVFVMPSLFEPWGHVFLEAMGCGLPCIGSAHCAMPEIITDSQTGLLVPPGEAEPLAEALVRLLDDPPLAEAWGRRAHASVIAEHRWSDVADRISPVLASAINDSPRCIETMEAQFDKRRRRPELGGRAQWRPRGLSSLTRVPGT
jgi:starch synthase